MRLCSPKYCTAFQSMLLVFLMLLLCRFVLERCPKRRYMFVNFSDRRHFHKLEHCYHHLHSLLAKYKDSTAHLRSKSIVRLSINTF